VLQQQQGQGHARVRQQVTPGHTAHILPATVIGGAAVTNGLPFIVCCLAQIGVRLNKDLIAVGARALRHNMTSLGPLVLPLSEQLTFAANYVVRQACKHSKALSQSLPVAWTRPYTPDFKKAFDFYCIHTGGRGIIDGLEKEMTLSRQQVEPSRASLYRFGNTSSTR
jgi:3-ketoacyl-CoA synthase